MHWNPQNSSVPSFAATVWTPGVKYSDNAQSQLSSFTKGKCV